MQKIGELTSKKKDIAVDLSSKYYIYFFLVIS